jgi:hypothetical protein
MCKPLAVENKCYHCSTVALSAPAGITPSKPTASLFLAAAFPFDGLLDLLTLREKVVAGAATLAAVIVPHAAGLPVWAVGEIAV